MIALGEQDEHHEFKFCWFEGNLQTLLGHNVLKTSKIQSKFIPCQKNIISIALTISHILLYMQKKIEKFQQ